MDDLSSRCACTVADCYAGCAQREVYSSGESPCTRDPGPLARHVSGSHRVVCPLGEIVTGRFAVVGSETCHRRCRVLMPRGTKVQKELFRTPAGNNSIIVETAVVTRIGERFIRMVVAISGAADVLVTSKSFSVSVMLPANIHYGTGT